MTCLYPFVLLDYAGEFPQKEIYGGINPHSRKHNEGLGHFINKAETPQVNLYFL